MKTSIKGQIAVHIHLLFEHVWCHRVKVRREKLTLSVIASTGAHISGAGGHGSTTRPWLLSDTTSRSKRRPHSYWRRNAKTPVYRAR